MLRFVIVIIVTLLLPRPAAALDAENLLVTIPVGYQVGFTDRKRNMVITEMVPAGQTVQDWTEMVTVQIFLGMKASPVEFRGRMETLWVGSCPNAVVVPVSTTTENGYATALWRQSCPLNKQTGKPEMTWFKAISGNDSFYVVQKAFKFEPPPEQVTEWLSFLNRVSVCDTRLPARNCPRGFR